MASSYLTPRSPREARRRTASLVLAVLAHLLVIWLLLRLSPPLMPTSDKQPGLTTFNVASEPGSKPKAQQKPKTLAKAHAAQHAAIAPRADHPPTEQPPTPPVPSLFGHNSSLFAGGDIGKIASADDSASSDSGAGSGKNSGSTYGPGEGPGGAHVYNVGFMRNPTRAELSPYMPPGGVQTGNWGQIICQMVSTERVDNCRTAGESPVGSGIARGMRLAAWQFKVRVPRVDGKPLIGAWVKIRMDFTDKAEPEGVYRPMTTE